MKRFITIALSFLIIDMSAQNCSTTPSGD